MRCTMTVQGQSSESSQAGLCLTRCGSLDGRIEVSLPCLPHRYCSQARAELAVGRSAVHQAVCHSPICLYRQFEFSLLLYQLFARCYSVQASMSVPVLASYLASLPPVSSAGVLSTVNFRPQKTVVCILPASILCTTSPGPRL